MELELVVDKVSGRVEPWQGNLLASGSRLVLINNHLTNIPMFIMGFYLLQDGIHEKLDRVRSRFFWPKELGKQKYHMVKWDVICSPKETGRLGVINSKIMNWCLIAKWAWKILMGQGGLRLDKLST